MQRKKRSKRQREARNRKWSKRWQRSKYLPRKAPVEAVRLSDGDIQMFDNALLASSTHLYTLKA